MEKLRLANPARPWLPSRYLSSSSCWRIPLCQLLRRSLYHLRTPQHHCGWIQDHVNWRFVLKIDWKNWDKKMKNKGFCFYLNVIVAKPDSSADAVILRSPMVNSTTAPGTTLLIVALLTTTLIEAGEMGPFICYTIQFKGLRPPPPPQEIQWLNMYS